MSRPRRQAVATIGLLIIAAGGHAATDLSVAIITAPVSACVLGSNEKVTLKLFNHGDALPTGTRFEVSFAINAGAPVVEPVTLAAPLPTDAVFTYTFHGTADLSVPGPHRIDATARIAGDAKPDNNALSGHLAIHFAASQGGTLTGPVAASAGVLALTGAIGSVRQWEHSTNAGERWQVEDSQTDTWTFDKLTRTTQFRAEVQNGPCAPAYSSTWTVAPN